MKVLIYAVPDQLENFLAGKTDTFKAAYYNVTGNLVSIEVDDEELTLMEDTFDNIDVFRKKHE